MRVSKLDWSPYFLHSMREKINKKPQYQRTEVWATKKKIRLIDSMLRGFDVPKFYVASSDEPYDYEVVDGQQRLTAILAFMDGKFALEGQFDRWGDLTGKKFSDLPPEINRYFGNFQLHFVLLDEVQEGEVEELFIRLQEGVPANSTEKRNAIIGNLRDFVADLAETHSIFKYSKIKSARFNWHDYTAHVLCLELNEGPTDLSGKSLTDMYLQQTDFSVDGKIAKKVKRIFNFWHKGIKSKTKGRILPELSAKWPFVDLYWLTSCFLDEYAINDQHRDIIEFYVSFETKRSKIRRKDEEDLARGDFWDRQLFKYLQAFRSEGNKRDKVSARHEVYRLFALQYFAENKLNLIPKDPKRAFTEEERILIWRRADCKCQNSKCSRKNKRITLKEMEADHIIPHSKGGKTIINNGQCLCVDCNRRKAGKL